MTFVFGVYNLEVFGFGIPFSFSSLISLKPSINKTGDCNSKCFIYFYWRFHLEFSEW
jgi:hypothetical protein